ncbi:Cell division protein ZipA, interacts with FtsZ [Nitrosomonas sp. Nm51]|uniref:cell division protein ZipA C-terminal FtsZ-binding domain-containing protein n=1 Tax=Nitrosomonas sp. Nm51 TaxID=133720 RepID=UPI0008AE7EAB|nr:cell division protein ZipA C-terminal FtsZ-binding domain-containing protein [Nitrosomonas sp. Nm51]SER08982.1 Cell division protein ZipA, interacts with FtsZ [Nitrosomonas sp. Nm51]
MDLLNMSDLQVSLIIIGIVIIVGVAIFNWAQQVRYRRRIESTLDHQHDDALFKKNDAHRSPETHKRIEPELDQSFFLNNTSQHIPTIEPGNIPEINSLPEDNSEAKTPVETETFSPADVYDSRSNYIVIISADDKIPDTELDNLLQRRYEFSKPLLWFGKSEKSSAWEEITTGTTTKDTSFTSLRGCLLLADRSGPIREIDLSKFRDTVQDFASHIEAKIECPDIVCAHEQAILLDKFCADVDVMIGINIIGKDNGAFVGTKIRALAEASGFRLESDGVFKYRDENNHILFTLTNYEPDAFKPDKMKTITTHGVTFLLDVPRVANGERVFDQMTQLAKIFANTLGGIMVDDNRVPLSENGLARSKQQLINIQSSMKENNIIAGSPHALRLFN